MANSYNEELSIGDRIGRYEILSVLGSGSMGMVYKCRHDVLGRIVAIKTLRLQRTTDDRTQKRFIREAQMANRLNHPNLIGLVDFGNMANNDPYLVMEFVSGQSLYEIMKRERYLIPERAVALFSQVADGLYHAHQRGVIHRDLKPANMLVVKNEDGSETVKIVDLGVAKIVHGSEDEEAEAITMTGEVCGSPIYLSPEQCMYQELDARTDIYSLGVCLYECLTGTPPLRGATVYDTIYMHVHDTPRPFHQVAVNPDIPKRLEEVVLRCLAKQPKDRYDTMIHLKKELIDSLKPQSASNSGVKVLPPEQLFSGANSAPKRPPEPPGAGTAPGQQSADGPVREFGKTSGKQSTDAPADESENRNSKISKKMPAAPEPAVKGPEELSKAATKSKKQGSKKKSDGSGFGGKLASMGLDSLNPKTIGLLASMALVFFGFGSVFAYFLLKSTTNPTPPVVSSQTTAPDSTTASTNAAKQSPSTTASATPKASAFVEPDIAGAPITPEPGLLDRANAVPSSVSKPQAKAPTAAKSSAAAKAPQQPLSLNQMNNLLDSTDGSQSRFNSIVEQVPSHPVSQKSKQHGGGNSANPYYRQFTHLKAGRHLPPARPMPVLRRTAFNSGGQMGGPMGGMGGPMGGMGGNPMGGMGGPMGGMGGNPMGGMGGNPMGGMGGPMGGMGGSPMGGMGGNPMGAQGGGHGGGLLAKIQDFIASQSGGTIPPSGGNQNGGMGGMNGGASGGNNVMEQQAALSKEGTQLCESHQWAAACQKYEQAYKLNPGNMEVNQMYAYALNSYAVQLNKQGKYKEAVQYEKRAVSLYPDNQRYNNNLHNFSENAKNQAAGAL